MEPFCKVLVMETRQLRVLRPHLHENLVAREAHKKGVVKKCLFGVADPLDTQRMLEEQCEVDRKRIFDKYGIDLQDIEDLENDQSDVENDKNGQNKPKPIGGRKILKAKRKSSGGTQSASRRNQNFITDYYSARKSLHQRLEKKDTQQN
ncbi:uncharacterized protein LOC132705352 [Cylas formicarius]|uniref:uncharacterized protein LOC132705352 n=1 Tax=Cylas formicarius TaxID=197179 RepID=UPI0029584FC3|nr:uncharacterized protein LOC132705352 [Cylas formicarius]